MKEFPDALSRVPNEAPKPVLDVSLYEKPAIVDTLDKGFSVDESSYFTQMGYATTQEELDNAIALFNSVSAPKSAEALGMSLEDMLIENEPLTLASGFTVNVSRARNGKVSFENPSL
jgi:hypothetical protein